MFKLFIIRKVRFIMESNLHISVLCQRGNPVYVMTTLHLYIYRHDRRSRNMGEGAILIEDHLRKNALIQSGPKIGGASGNPGIPTSADLDTYLTYAMVVRVVEFSSGGWKIRKKLPKHQHT